MNAVPENRPGALGLPAAATAPRRSFRAFSQFLYEVFIRPINISEKLVYKEILSNILLTILALAATCAAALTGYYALTLHPSAAAAPLYFDLFITSLITTAVSWTLLYVSRIGYTVDAARGFITVTFILTTLSLVLWHVPVAFVVLSYLFVFISAILIRTTYTGVLILIITAGIVNIVPALNNLVGLSLIIEMVILLGLLRIFENEIDHLLIRSQITASLAYDERAELAERIEKHAEELKQTQIAHAANINKLTEFGQLASGVFHDLMSPLTAVITSLDASDAANAAQAPHAAKEHARIALNASRRMEALINSIQKQFQTHNTEQWFFPENEIRDVLDILGHKIRSNSVTVSVLPADSFRIMHKPIQFYQVVLNLLSNAIDACSNKPQRKVVISMDYQHDRSQFRLHVHDTGCGISPERLANLFEPFHSTKEAGKGLGLGLAAIKHIIDTEFGGSLTLKSAVDEGSVFTVSIPLPASRIQKVG